MVVPATVAVPRPSFCNDDRRLLLLVISLHFHSCSSHSRFLWIPSAGTHLMMRVRFDFDSSAKLCCTDLSLTVIQLSPPSLDPVQILDTAESDTRKWADLWDLQSLHQCRVLSQECISALTTYGHIKQTPLDELLRISSASETTLILLHQLEIYLHPQTERAALWIHHSWWDHIYCMKVKQQHGK